MSSEKDANIKKKDRRRAYLNDFQKDENGTYVYRGAVYDYTGEKASLLSVKLRLGALGIVMLLSLVFAGLIQTPGMDHSVYILLPYAAGLCGSVSVCWALLRLGISKPPLREYVYQETVLKLPGRAVFTACCSVIALIGEPVYLLWHRPDVTGTASVLFPILEGIALAAALLVRACVLQMKWHIHKETAAK